MKFEPRQQLFALSQYFGLDFPSKIEMFLQRIICFFSGHVSEENPFGTPEFGSYCLWCNKDFL